MRQILEQINLTDYRLQSHQTLKFTLPVIDMLVFLMLAAELLYDLQSIERTIIICTAIAAFAITMLYFFAKVPIWIVSNGLVLIIYGTAEAHLLYNPKTFITTIYWLPFAPLIAVVTQGLRAAKFWIIVVICSHVFNTWRLQHIYGEGYDIHIRTLSYTVSGFIFFASFMAGIFLLYKLLGDAYIAVERENRELETLKNTLAENKKQFEYYQAKLITLTRHPELFDWEEERFYDYLCNLARQTLQITRVSIWRLDEQHEYLECKYLSQQNRQGDEKVVLYRKDCPIYFQALVSTPYIAADDARTHEATRCFTNSYLSSLGIMSLLDCPILSEGKPVGVICCEQQYNYKNWKTQDILFVQSLADLVALYYKNLRIKSLLLEISEQNRELVTKTHEVETMNEELNALNEKLQTINDTLEMRVEERTRQLEIQNQQLREYAFINAHLLRAPLARIRGLLYLMTCDPNETKNNELIDTLIREANELDIITTKISDILYDGNNLTREDIQRVLANKKPHPKV